MKIKFISLDNLMATILVLVILKFLPIIFSIDMYDPIQGTLEDMQISDLVFSQLMDKDKIKLDTNIVLVNNGHLDREEFSEMMNTLNEYEPKVIGIDAMFRNLKDMQMDFKLSAAFSNTNKLVLVCGLLHTKDNKKLFDTIETSHPIFNQFAHNGYANVISDDDVNFRTVREMTPIQKVNDSIVHSFPIKVLSFYDNNKVKKFLKRGNENEIINYKRNINKYITLDIDDIKYKSEKLKQIKNKIVLIGYLGPNIKTQVTEDIFFTPMNEMYVGKTDPDMYGIVIHANVISMLLEEDFINSTPSWFNYFITIIIIYLNMFIFSYLRENYDFWYQTLSFVFIFGQIFIYSMILISFIFFFNFEIKITGMFFAIIICIAAFEGYTDSLKPIVTENIEKIKNYTNI